MKIMLSLSSDVTHIYKKRIHILSRQISLNDVENESIFH